MRSDILEGIQQVVNEFLEIDTEIEPEMDILYDLQLDSVELMTLVAELENHFRVSFNEGDELNVNTIDDLISLIDKYLTEQYCDSNE